MNQAAATPAWEWIGLLVFEIPLLYLIGKFGMSRQRKFISDWASSNGYQLLESEPRDIFLCPFARIPISAYDAVVWYAKVLTHDDNAHQDHIRHVWLRLSGRRLIQTSPDIKIRWDEKHDHH